MGVNMCGQPGMPCVFPSITAVGECQNHCEDCCKYLMPSHL